MGSKKLVFLSACADPFHFLAGHQAGQGAELAGVAGAVGEAGHAGDAGLGVGGFGVFFGRSEERL